MTKLINCAVKDHHISLETIVLHAQAYKTTKTKLEIIDPDVEEQVNVVVHKTQEALTSSTRRASLVC